MEADRSVHGLLYLCLVLSILAVFGPSVLLRLPSSHPALTLSCGIAGDFGSRKMVQADSWGSDLGRRVRYCRSCKRYVKGFDHHCPAFGNCIGQNNHALFMVLLAGFLATEALYIVCSYQFAAKSQIIDRATLEVVFMTWHMHCICLNIRTEEWINWKKYPEFQQVVQSQSGENEVRFQNPYDKGIAENVKEFLALE
ncbi:Palmitoyltransferase AKR1 [Morella rubra]|uniref:S-acyltransferase n=1 Tax=Morella rubra TaxID=262757 RepID=A0A6A1WNJ3_9ROSI|nr:Palmitoyltransferase AKR1 [Morella rubra]